MAHFAELWLPILLAAVAAFALSAVFHMALPWRRKEWGPLARSEGLRAALSPLPPGQYAFPAPTDPKQGMTKAWMEAWAMGPSGWVVIAPRGPIRMGRNMGLTFLTYLAVAFMVAYVADLGLGSSPGFLDVLRISSTTGFLTLGVATIFNSIWYARPWRVYLMDAGEALVIAFAMAGLLGWLWPR